MDVIKRYTAAQCWWSVVAFLTFEPRSQEGEVTYKKTKPKCGSRLPRDTPGSPIFLFFVSPPPPSSPFLPLPPPPPSPALLSFHQFTFQFRPEFGTFKHPRKTSGGQRFIE